MNENVAMYSVLGAVLLVTIAGLYITTDSNQITGRANTDLKTFTGTLQADLNFNWDASSSGTVTPGTSPLISWYTDNSCTGVGCTAVGFTDFTGTIIANAPTDFFLYVDSPNKWGGVSQITGNIPSVIPLPAPGCNKLAAGNTALGTLVLPTEAVLNNPVGTTTVIVRIGAENVDPTFTPAGAPQTVALTGTLSPSLGIC